MPMVYHNSTGMTHPRFKGYLPLPGLSGSGCCPPGLGAVTTDVAAAASSLQQLALNRVDANKAMNIVNDFVGIVCNNMKSTGGKPLSTLELTSIGSRVLEQHNLSSILQLPMTEAFAKITVIATDLARLGRAIYDKDICGFRSMNTPTTTTSTDGGEGLSATTALLIAGAMLGGALLLRR